MRMYLKNNKKFFKRKKFILFIFIFLIIISFSYILVNNLNSFYLNYSVRKVRVIIDKALNSAINEDVLKNMESKNIFYISKNNNDEIETIDYNTYLVNLFLKDITDNIENSLHEEEINKNSIYFYIPALAIFNNPLINDKGPRIPVKMEMVGTVLSSVKTNIKEYGINNALVEVFITIEIEEKVILPVSTKNIKVKNEFPISYKIIKGVVPNYYGGEISKNSSIYAGLLNK